MGINHSVSHLQTSGSQSLRLRFLSDILQMKSQTGINVRVFPALLQDRREVLTATSIRVTRTLVEVLIWPFSRRLCKRRYPPW